MVTETYFPILDALFESGYCLDAVERIWQNDRLFSFDAFERTADFVEDYFTNAGLSQVERLRLNADGRTRYGDWVIPRAWYAKSATLRSDGGEVFADYLSEP